MSTLPNNDNRIIGTAKKPSGADRRHRVEMEHRFTMLACVLLIACQTAVYGWIWYYYYVGQSFLRVHYWNRGNWVYVGMFAVYVIIFGLIYKSFSISYSSAGELVLSHIVMQISVHLVAFVQLSFIVQKYWLRWNPLAISFGINLLISIVWCIACKILYKRLFPPRDALLITEPASRIHNNNTNLKDRTHSQYMVRDTISSDAGWEAIENKINTGSFQTVIVGEIDEKLRNNITKLCYDLDIPCYVVPSIYDILLLGSKRITHFDTPLQYFKNEIDPPAEESVIKRIVDIVLSIAILMITSPIFLITVLAVLLDTGKVFAKHEMLTKDGKKFNLMRFQVRNTDYEPSWKGEEYLRQYSPVGQTINRLHIAGLPQLFNVIKGDISLVGPRPYSMKLTAQYYDELGPEVLYRLRVKGGLLGNAQLNAKKGSSPMDILKMDIDYIENFSLRQDALIILRSIVPH